MAEAEATSQLSNIGNPQLVTYGYGETKFDSKPTEYTSGLLKRIVIQVPLFSGFVVLTSCSASAR